MDIMNILASCLLIHTYAYMHIHVYGWFIPSELFESKLQVWRPLVFKHFLLSLKTKPFSMIQTYLWYNDQNQETQIFKGPLLHLTEKIIFFLWFRSACCIYILWSVSLFLVWNSNSTWPCLSWVPHILKSTGYLIERRHVMLLCD